ncbi:DUF397 domain-containing protein [Streptomyces sp. NBRC 109706]|uniref:DUF397 domain-containing protein n=1 Tax=Streptomyces sp. NBRC 109706 TaxID=1550035 RepID=UPI0007828002|nr:DUF397 domain-containing protein [Streptomyces sp. NBRC 109706]
MTESPNSPWRTSSYSNAGGNCVQIAHLTENTVAIRDSKAPGSGTLRFTPTQLTAWLESIKRG